MPSVQETKRCKKRDDFSNVLTSVQGTTSQAGRRRSCVCCINGWSGWHGSCRREAGSPFCLIVLVSKTSMFFLLFFVQAELEAAAAREKARLEMEALLREAQ
jgi:hypothetical protein